MTHREGRPETLRLGDGAVETLDRHRVLPVRGLADMGPRPVELDDARGLELESPPNEQGPFLHGRAIAMEPGVDFQVESRASGCVSCRYPLQLVQVRDAEVDIGLDERTVVLDRREQPGEETHLRSDPRRTQRQSGFGVEDADGADAAVERRERHRQEPVPVGIRFHHHHQLGGRHAGGEQRDIVAIRIEVDHSDGHT